MLDLGSMISSERARWGRELNGGFRAHPEHKLVGLGVDDLLGEGEMGERHHCAQQGGVTLPQLKQEFDDKSILPQLKQQGFET